MIEQGNTNELAQTSSQTVERALRLVDVMAAHGGALRLAELARVADLNSRTTARLLGTLVRFGYVRHDADGRYVLGYHLLRLAQTVEKQIGLAEIAAPVLDGLVAATDESATVCILEENRAIIAARSVCKLQLRVASPVGSILPLSCTAVGKLLLAYQPEAQIASVLAQGMPAHTARTITDPTAMAVELAHIRAMEYAVDRSEWEEGLICIAAPVRDAGGTVIAACGMGATEQWKRHERVSELVHAVRDAAALLSHRLGYTPSRGGPKGQLVRLET